MTAPPSADVARDESRAWPAEHDSIMRLCQDASLEMTFHDTALLGDCRTLRAPGSEIFVSHLPRQEWRQSLEVALEVRHAGFTPVPHLPVRQLESARELDALLKQLVNRAGVAHVLLIAGDRAQPIGPFAASTDVLRTGLLERHGIRRLSLAGHPEGHPRVAAELIRAAELEKWRLAEDAGFEVSFVTQFAFDSEPVVRWTRELRSQGMRGAIYVGLAGPARLSTLLQYAVRCGVGPSIRALGTRAASFGRLLGERGPESLVRELAHARDAGLAIDGIHLFSFGGLLRTCRWLHTVTRGGFALDDSHGFTVDEAG